MIDIEKDIEVRTGYIGEELLIVKATLRLSDGNVIPIVLQSDGIIDRATLKSKRKIMEYLYGDIKSELCVIHSLTHPYDASGKAIRERLETLINSL